MSQHIEKLLVTTLEDDSAKRELHFLEQPATADDDHNKEAQALERILNALARVVHILVPVAQIGEVLADEAHHQWVGEWRVEVHVHFCQGLVARLVQRTFH